jgi:hypothetical protein
VIRSVEEILEKIQKDKNKLKKIVYFKSKSVVNSTDYQVYTQLSESVISRIKLLHWILGIEGRWCLSKIRLEEITQREGIQ